MLGWFNVFVFATGAEGLVFGLVSALILFTLVLATVLVLGAVDVLSCFADFEVDAAVSLGMRGGFEFESDGVPCPASPRFDLLVDSVAGFLDLLVDWATGLAVAAPPEDTLVWRS